MKPIAFQISANPVLIKEMRGRMRGARAYVFLTFILLLMGAISYGLYRLGALVVQSTNNPGMIGVVIGQTLFVGLIYLSLLIICAITPALTASAISGEHERRTFDLLAATPLYAASILFGKLMAALSYVALIVLATAPFLSLAYLFGGISTIDLIQALLLLIGFALTFCVIGLFFSALFRRTGVAAVASYIVLTICVLGSLAAYIAVALARRGQPPNWVLALNPFSAMASALVTPADVAPSGFFGVSSFLMPLLWLLSGGTTDTFSITNVRVPPLWQYTVGVYAWITITLYLISMQLIQPVRRWRGRAQTWVLIVGLFFVLPVIYGPLQPSRLFAAFRWAVTPSRDLVRNGKFDAPLESAWTAGPWDANRNAPANLQRVSEGNRAFVRLASPINLNLETRITQSISQTIPSGNWLQVRALVRINKQTRAQCGDQGDTCPLMIAVNYSDEKGVKHNWTQGFFITPGTSSEYCRSCESRQAHIRLTAGNWYTFESPNVAEAFAPLYAPRVINALVISANGTTYESDVAEISLLTRDGRPLNLRERLNILATPTPAAGFLSRGF